MGRIKTDKELKFSKKKYKEIEDQLKEMKKNPTGKVLEKAGFFGLQAFGEDIKFEIEEYEKIKAGKVPEYLLKSSSPQSLGDALIALRIASGKTQSDLAKDLEVASTQICRDERNEYHGISSVRLFKILDLLGYDIEIKKKK